MAAMLLLPMYCVIICERSKFLVMKTNSTQQEILLLTDTTFTSRQWLDREDASGKTNNLSERERLEQACWNGLLAEMLPEIVEKTDASKPLYLWQIKGTASFLELELGEYPEAKDNYFSIDPYSFLGIQPCN